MTPYILLAVAVPAIMGLGDATHRHFARERQRQLGHSVLVQNAKVPWTFFDLVAVAVLVTFSAVRFGIGLDYLTYAALYEGVDTGSWTEAIAASPQEVGFTVLMLAIRFVDPAPATFFWVTSILTVVPAYVAIRQVSARPILSVLLYVLLAVYLLPFNVVRQGIAISLLFYATTCLRRRPAAFLLVCAVAASIHVSVVIALVLMWVAHRWRPTPLSAGLILTSVVVAVVSVDRFPVLGDVARRVNPRYEAYLSAPDAGLGTYLQIVALLALVAYAAWLGLQAPEVAARTGWMVTFALVGVALMIVATQAIPFARLAVYFTIYLVLLLPERVAAARNPIPHEVAIVTGAAAFYVFYLGFYGGLVPYQTYLFN